MNSPNTADANRTGRLGPAADDAPAPSIRVLARLPRIGQTERSNSTELPTFDALDDGHRASTGECADQIIRFDEPAQSFAVCTGANANLAESSASPGLGRHHSDAPRDDLPHVEHDGSTNEFDGQQSGISPNSHGVAAPAAAADSSAVQAAAARRFRIDAADARRAPRRSDARRQDAKSLTGSIFQVYSALAPHAGMLSAGALVIAGSLIYWLAFARTGATVDPRSLLEFQNGWSEQAAPPHEPADLPNSDAASESNLSQNATPDDTQPTDAAIDGWEPTLPAAEAQGIPIADELADVPPTDAAPSPVDDVVMPTPQTMPYPVTPYPTFAWEAAAVAPVGAEPPTMAERPATPAWSDIAPR